MQVANSTRGIILTLLITTLASTGLARQIQFSKEVPEEQTSALLKDLASDFSLENGADALRVMGIDSLSDQNLKEWLNDRVGYVIGENEDLDNKIVGIQTYRYENPNILPTLEKPEELPAPPEDPVTPEKPKRKVYTVMSNLGASLYYYGKTKSILVGYKFSSPIGEEVVPITSPRTGLIRIGEGLFAIKPVKDNPNSIVNKWFRLETFFHEAHHSDGNGKSLGYLHAVCPKGHRYYNYNACDRNDNGPYAVGAYLLKQVRVTCMKNKSCSAAEAEMLANLSTDNYSRLIGKTSWDPKPEGTGKIMLSEF
jgi:hypothetical protein